MALIQIRVEDDLKDNAMAICDHLGLDLSTAIRMFLKKTVQTKGIPFSVSLGNETIDYKTAYDSLMKCGEIAKKNGTSNMTMDEIDAEIRAYRKERKEKK